jgi:hypothetical protein
MSCLHLKREKRKNMGSHCIVNYGEWIWSSCLLLSAKLGICVPWSHSYVLRIVCSLLNIQSSNSRAAMTCTHHFQWSFILCSTADVVDRLAKEGKQIEALSFAHSFEIMDRVQPVPLLKTYLKEARKTAQSILKTGNSSTAAQVIRVH